PLSKALRRSSREIVDLARERALAMAPTERPAAVITPIWSLSSSDRCEEAGIATLPKVLISHADTKSAGGVALRVRTQDQPFCKALRLVCLALSSPMKLQYLKILSLNTARS